METDVSIDMQCIFLKEGYAWIEGLVKTGGQSGIKRMGLSLEGGLNKLYAAT